MRIALVGATASLALSLAMTAIAGARPSTHRHHAVRTQTAASQPDQVLQWNQELQKVLVALGAQPASIHPTRTLAITQIAVSDAVNGIGHGGEPFLVGIGADRAVRRPMPLRLPRHAPRSTRCSPASSRRSTRSTRARLAQLGSGEAG